MQYNTIEYINNIPSMPEIMSLTLDAIKDAANAKDNLIKIIEKDMELAEQIVHLSNSPFYSAIIKKTNEDIDTVSKTVNYLDIMITKNIIITNALKKMMIDYVGIELWVHSVKCALSSEIISQELNIFNPDDAYILGFLHDIGKILLYKDNPELFEKIMKIAQEKETESTVIEQEQFGINHATISAKIIEKWGLPQALSDCIKYHHEPFNSTIPYISGIIYCADRLIQKDIPTPIISDNILERINIHFDDTLLLRETLLTKSELLLRELI